MRIVGIIPCRYDSKRFPGKALTTILGKPLIQWVYERASQANICSYVAVATDDERIFHCIQDAGGEALMTGQAHRSGSDRVAEAAARLDLGGNDLVINVQGDQPAFHPACLSEVISPLAQDPGLYMSTLICKIDDVRGLKDPHCVKCVFDKEGYALYFSRSAIPFDRDETGALHGFKHLGIYAFRKHFLDRFAAMPQGRLEGLEKLEQLRVLEHGYRIKVVQTDHDSQAIDSREDIARLEPVLRAGD